MHVLAETEGALGTWLAEWVALRARAWPMCTHTHIQTTPGLQNIKCDARVRRPHKQTLRFEHVVRKDVV